MVWKEGLTSGGDRVACASGTARGSAASTALTPTTRFPFPTNEYEGPSYPTQQHQGGELSQKVVPACQAV